MNLSDKVISSLLLICLVVVFCMGGDLRQIVFVGFLYIGSFLLARWD